MLTILNSRCYSVMGRLSDYIHTHPFFLLSHVADTVVREEGKRWQPI